MAQELEPAERMRRLDEVVARVLQERAASDVNLAHEERLTLGREADRA